MIPFRNPLKYKHFSGISQVFFEKIEEKLKFFIIKNGKTVLYLILLNIYNNEMKKKYFVKNAIHIMADYTCYEKIQAW